MCGKKPTFHFKGDAERGSESHPPVVALVGIYVIVGNICTAD